MTANQSIRRVRRKQRQRKRRIMTLLTIAAIAFLSVLSYGAYIYVKADSTFSQSYQADGRLDGSDLRDGLVVNPGKDNVSVLIMGVDVSDKRLNHDNARTDTVMIATLNITDKSVKLLSIPRDSLVYIPLKDRHDKINHAHAYGGAKATIDTVEALLDIPIDFHVTVNFEAFIDVVDALNGIKVNVPYELYEQDSKDVAGAIHLLPGLQTLDGEQALALARTRKMDNDIERGKRQQEIIKAIIDKSISLGSVLKYDNIIDAIGANMTTNMSFSEMKSFITYGTAGSNLSIDTLTIAGSNYQPSNIYYWKLDDASLNETKLILNSHLELKNNF